MAESTLQKPHEPPSPKPPRGPSWLVIGVVAAVAVGGVVVGANWGGPIYHGLADLLSQNQHTHAAAAKQQYWTCAMHPFVMLPEPGDCPICHMKLVPYDPKADTGAVAVDPVMAQSIGVRVGTVTRGPLTMSLRTAGNVDYDETRVRDITVKAPGYIEKLYIDTTGAVVAKGDKLFTLYSDDIYNAQNDYLVVLKNTLISPDLVGIIEQSRRRLQYFDMSDEQIDALRKRGVASKTITIQSPYAGQVTVKNVVEGQKAEPGTALYRIADLSRVWVIASLYEYQLPYVQVGQKAAMTLPYIPGMPFEGKVTYIAPMLSADTRQAKVRLEFDNPGQLLKPGMFANVEIQSTLAADRTLAPREAIVDTGTRQLAFVSLGDGKFEPRDVKLGADGQDGLIEVLSGLKPGDHVVTSGQFLLDSEVRMREATAKMLEGQLAVAKVATRPAATSRPTAADAFAQAAAKTIAAYVAIGDTLADGKLAGVGEQARATAAGIDEMIHAPLADEHFWTKYGDAAGQARGKALELVRETDLDAARQKYADLSASLSVVLRAAGVPESYGELVELHCPMYRENQHGSIWLQPAGSARNPFMEPAMRGCYDQKTDLPGRK